MLKRLSDIQGKSLRYNNQMRKPMKHFGGDCAKNKRTTKYPQKDKMVQSWHKNNSKNVAFKKYSEEEKQLLEVKNVMTKMKNQMEE